MSLRRRVRFALDRLGQCSGLMTLFERAMRRRLTILTYHRVLPEATCQDYPFPAMAMPLGAFREQVRWLADRCELRSVSEALAAPEPPGTSGPPGPGGRRRPVVCLTFDDGYADNA